MHFTACSLNKILRTTYHPGFWNGRRWSCCKNTQKSSPQACSNCSRWQTEEESSCSSLNTSQDSKFFFFICNFGICWGSVYFVGRFSTSSPSKIIKKKMKISCKLYMRHSLKRIILM